MHVNKTNTSVTTTLSLNEPLWPTHSSALSQHTCCQDRRSQRPRGHSGPLWMEEWAKPWTLTNCWSGRTFMSACLHVTSRHPRGCVGSGAELSCIVYPEPGHPPPCARADYPAVSRPLFHGSGCTTLAFSHCEVVWEKHSSLDPGENNIRTSQTRACVPIRTVVTGLAAVSLLRHPRLAVITSQLKGLKEMNVWIEKKQSLHELSTIFMFLLLLVFCFYLSSSWRFGMC